VRALLYKAKTLDVSLPILPRCCASNQLQIERGVQAVVEKGHKKIGILGFSFTRPAPTTCARARWSSSPSG